MTFGCDDGNTAVGVEKSKAGADAQNGGVASFQMSQLIKYAPAMSRPVLRMEEQTEKTKRCVHTCTNIHARKRTSAGNYQPVS
jgi:hypothetical protein